MSTARASSFNCTECGAGLDALGGGRVRVHICSYCGAELDAQDDYKVLAKYRDLERPASPFSIGMTGELWGVGFTVIGTMAWVEFHNGKRWEWVNHQLYSPTHGYAWLTVEDGFVTYARKQRMASSPTSLSESFIENAERRPSVSFGGQSFRYYSSGRIKPTFIEGEFNYRPSLDESARYVSLLGHHQMLDIIESGQEREYELVSLPDQAATLASFDVPAGRWPKPRGVHPLQVYHQSPFATFARTVFFVASAVTLLIGLMLSGSGQTISQSETVGISRDVTLPFEITNAGRLTEIEIWANAYNSWAWFEAELLDGEGEPVAEFERGVEYYKGSDWSEGSQRVRTRLHLPPGTYELSINNTQAVVDWAGGTEATRYQITVSHGVNTTFWLWITAVVFGVLGLAQMVGPVVHNTRRMAGSDWSDD
ncbi:MAG: DUF4178 domain-containing protein [Paracoccaceae bacterium]|nr:DUF4178 domain-containing protein [Paracoccaceae bacterium]